MAEANNDVQKISGLLGNIPRLNSRNYPDWSFAISMVLRRAGAWELVTADTVDRNKKKDVAKLQEALTAIGLTIEPSQYSYIRDAEDGQAAWKALEKIYSRSSRANRISLKRQFYGYRHDTNEPIQKYISDILQLAARLKAIGVALTDKDIIDVLIMNLDKEWDGVASTLSTVMDDDRLLSEVTGALSNEEYRRGGPPENTAAETALIAARNPQNRGIRDRICYECRKPGHIARFCREKKEEKEVKSETANLAFEIAY
jgi:hypothetical protein